MERCRGPKGRFIKAGVKRRLENLKRGNDEGTKRRLIERGNCIPKTSCNVSSNEELKWNEGRRIIDLSVLANGLEKCSDKECIMPLSLKNIERETKLGLSSI